jgi:hypothetical protein
MKLGPEVLILSETINKLYYCEKKAYGKHLFIFNDKSSVFIFNINLFI